MGALALLQPSPQRIQTMALWRNLKSAHLARRRGDGDTLDTALSTLRSIAVLGATERLRERARIELADLDYQDR